MLFYASKKADSTFELIKFPDGRPVPVPFRRLLGEHKLTREFRRMAYEAALHKAGYSEIEYKGRTDVQARLSERFEDSHFMQKIDSNSVYLVDYAYGDQAAQNQWNNLKTKMGNDEGIAFEVPDHLTSKCKNTGKYIVPAFNPTKEENTTSDKSEKKVAAEKDELSKSYTPLANAAKAKPDNASAAAPQAQATEEDELTQVVIEFSKQHR